MDSLAKRACLHKNLESTLFEMAMSSTVDSILEKVQRERLDSRVSDGHLAQIARDLKKWEGLVPLLGLTEAQEEEVRSTFRDYGTGHGRHESVAENSARRSEW